MRDARPESSPYPKADLTLRALARLVDFGIAFLVVFWAPPVGPLAAALYLLAADSLFRGQSAGKRLFGVRAMVVPRRAPAGVQESLLRNSPFALVAVFASVTWLWPLLIAGVVIVAFETYLVLTDRLGIRIGDVFADTQVVDAKVVVQDAQPARTLATPTPVRPSSSASA